MPGRNNPEYWYKRVVERKTPEQIREEKRDQAKKLRLAERYQLQILCWCLAPCELVGYDAKGEGGRWQCSRNREHWD